MSKINCKKIIRALRENKENLKNTALEQAYRSNDIWEKCVLLRTYTSDKGLESEKLIKSDLQIAPPVDNISGDGFKNGLNYEIKVSIHANDCKLNIRQIRPHHNIHFYIIMYLNIWAGDNGKAYIFKIPSKKIYDLVLEYGGYTHGTIERNGPITIDSIKDKKRDFEYSLSANPNAREGTKSKILWNELIKYSIPYKKEEF